VAVAYCVRNGMHFRRELSVRGEHDHTGQCSTRRRMDHRGAGNAEPERCKPSSTPDPCLEIG
jgi:hypothetical protein